MEVPAVTPTVVRPWTQCQVCKHVWHLTDAEVKPRECPNCGTMCWAAERGWKKTTMPGRRVLPAGTVWLVCSRCGHQWFVRSGVLPVRCAQPKCGSPYWHRARVRGVAVKVAAEVGDEAVA